MPQYTLWTDEVIKASDFTYENGERIVLLSSSEVNNGGGSSENSIVVELDFENLTPSFISAYIGVVIEGKTAANTWVPIHYMFSDYTSSSTANKRTLRLQPNLDTYNAGIDEIVFVAGEEEGRIARSQGQLPQTAWRVCVLMRETDKAGPNAFQEVTLSATAETYSV